MLLPAIVSAQAIPKSFARRDTRQRYFPELNL